MRWSNVIMNDDMSLGVFSRWQREGKMS